MDAALITSFFCPEYKYRWMTVQKFTPDCSIIRDFCLNLRFLFISVGLPALWDIPENCRRHILYMSLLGGSLECTSMYKDLYEWAS